MANSPNLSSNLPLLPGYVFRDSKKVKFHKSHFLDYKFGVAEAKLDLPGTGNDQRDIDSMKFLIYDPVYRMDPDLIYGEKDKARKKLVQPFRPHYVTHDRSCLKFQGHFKQLAFNTAYESYRIRVVDLLYFLEDDTVSVIEPKVANSGLPQGRLVRRSRIPQGPLPDCEYLHWKDLNLGKEFLICGFVIRLVDCDDFTRQFLESQGVELNETESIPTDDYNQKRHQTPPQRPATAANSFKLRQFLQYDGIILKFRAVWENEGDNCHYGVNYYLSDNTIQITEIHEKNDGKDFFPVLLKRTRLPKAWNKIPITYPSNLDEAALEVTEYYMPSDLVIGQRIVVYGRDMLLNACDDFTREFYKRKFNIAQPENFPVEKQVEHQVKPQLPPYTGFGTLEDSLQSCLSFSMKSPRKDIIRKIVNANHFLRYRARLCSSHPEDAGREFILSYSLADGTLTITEPAQRNSGHVGGRFLSGMKVSKPNTTPDFPEFYSPHDFFIGNIVIVNQFQFEIVGADLHVFKYMEANAEKFRPEVRESISNYIRETGLLNENK